MNLIIPYLNMLFLILGIGSINPSHVKIGNSVSIITMYLIFDIILSIVYYYNEFITITIMNVLLLLLLLLLL